jgi:hypothetical protein
MRGFVERFAYSGIADLADPAGPVSFSRLILFRCEPKMRPRLLRRCESRRIVDR